MKNPKQIFRTSLIVYITFTVIVAIFLFNSVAFAAVTVNKVEFIGQATLPTGFLFQKTEVGGLSGITYDRKNQLYYAISDDRGQKAAPRFYTLKINLSKGKLTNSDVDIVAVTEILDTNNQPFLPSTTDTEGIALTDKDTVFISSEGDVKKLISPFVKEFSLASGKELSQLAIPEKFLPDANQRKGIRNNLAFESLTITPNQEYLFTATENALISDGEIAKPSQGSNCRILQYNLLTKQPEKEFLYPTTPVTPIFNFTGRFDSGLPDLLALDNQGHFLSIERSFTGLGFTILLYQVSLTDVDDIQEINSLKSVDVSKIKPVTKKLLLDLGSLDVALDNIEGLTLGSKLPNGQTSLILISDNNFNSLQRTQILAFQMKLESPLIRWLHRLSIFH